MAQDDKDKQVQIHQFIPPEPAKISPKKEGKPKAPEKGKIIQGAFGSSGESKRRRNKLMTIGSGIILGLILITFIGAPALSGLQPQAQFIFGYWDKTPIEYLPDNYFGYLVTRIDESNPRPSQAEQPQFNEFQEYLRFNQNFRQAYNLAVIHAALLSLGENEKLWITEEKINQALLQRPEYLDFDGKFDEQKYLTASQATQKKIYELTRDQLYQEEVAAGLMSFEQTASQGEQEFIRSLAAREKRIRYVPLNYNSYPVEGVMDFVREEPKLYSKIDLSRITIREDKALAEDLRSQLEENALLFEELARTYSVDNFNSQGGAMGTSYYFELRPNFDNAADLDALMDLGEGEISGVITAQDGYYLYRVNKAAEPPDPENSGDMSRIRSYMIQYEKSRMEDYYLEQGEELIAEAAAMRNSLLDAARRKNLSYHDTDFFPLIYGDVGFNFYGSDFALFTGLTVPDGDNTLSYAKTDSAFLTAVRDLSPENPLSPPVILDDAVVILQFLEEREAPEENLSMVGSYYSVGASAWKESLLNQYVINSPRHRDRFQETFGKLFGSPGW